jgi:hypothetical protein
MTEKKHIINSNLTESPEDSENFKNNCSKEWIINHKLQY